MMITKDYVRQLRNRLVHARTIDEQQAAADELRRVSCEVLSWPLRTEHQPTPPLLPGFETPSTPSTSDPLSPRDRQAIEETTRRQRAKIQRARQESAITRPNPGTSSSFTLRVGDSEPQIPRVPQSDLGVLGLDDSLFSHYTPDTGGTTDPDPIPAPPKENWKAYAEWATSIYNHARSQIHNALLNDDFRHVQILADRYLEALPDNLAMLELYSQVMLRLVIVDHISAREGERLRTEALRHFQALAEDFEKQLENLEDYAGFPPEIGEALQKGDSTRALTLATTLFERRHSAPNPREIIRAYTRVLDIAFDQGSLPRNLYNEARRLVAEELEFRDEVERQAESQQVD